MNESHFFRNALLAVGGLILVGWLAWHVLAFLSGILFYLIVGAIAVGGCVYLYGRAKRSLGSGGRKSIDR